VPDVLVRAATEADQPAIGAITVATGQQDAWAGTNPAYLRHLTGAGRVVVAELAGRIAGFGAVRHLGTGPDAVTMLCDLFVDPVAHGRGCGRAMLADLWGGQGRRMTFSSLHAHAVPLYTSFGLDAWWPLLYLHGDVRRLAASREWAADQVSPAAVAGAELRWTGLDRLADHQAWAGRPAAGCLLVRRDTEVIAAGTAIRAGADRGIVHLATDPQADDATAADAVVQALTRLGGPPDAQARVTLPAPHPAVRPLLAAGWRLDEFDLFMASEPGLLDARRVVPSPELA
jgi:GNAT superfamily N-acetyltransferase